MLLSTPLRRLCRVTLPLVFLLVGTPGLPAQDSAPAAVAPSAADLDWKAIMDLASFKAGGATRQEHILARDANIRALHTRIRDFSTAHPTDLRRWQGVVLMQRQQPSFINAFGPDFETKGAADATFDTAARAALQAEIANLRLAMADATDVPPAARVQSDTLDLASAIRAAIKVGARADWTGLRDRTLALAAKYPEATIVRSAALGYMSALEDWQPDAVSATWAAFAASPNPAVADAAKEKLAYIELIKNPLEIAFTAADGRAVDLAQLRGKVVLIDFWATWCGPCIAELPNVKKVYEAYHDQGFEIVGIALENGQLKPTDTPEQTAAKLEKAKKVLTDFTAKESMPWPQQFDGKFWKNTISTRYAISAIPAMFLLDRDGRIVSTNARGEKLETEVKRLLGL